MNETCVQMSRWGGPTGLIKLSLPSIGNGGKFQEKQSVEVVGKDMIILGLSIAYVGHMEAALGEIFHDLNTFGANYSK